MNNQLKGLSKEETKVLEKTTERFGNLFFYYKILTYDSDFSKYTGLLKWYIKHKVKDNIYVKWKKMAGLLNIKPTYFTNYRNRNAVWGLQYKNSKFILYLSIRGLDIQIKPESKENRELLYFLSDLLVDGKTDEEILKERKMLK